MDMFNLDVTSNLSRNSLKKVELARAENELCGLVNCKSNVFILNPASEQILPAKEAESLQSVRDAAEDLCHHSAILCGVTA